MDASGGPNSSMPVLSALLPYQIYYTLPCVINLPLKSNKRQTDRQTDRQTYKHRQDIS